MSASSRDLSIPDGLILFLPAVPGMLFLYIAEVIPKVCAGLGLALGLSTQSGQRKFIYDVFKNIHQPGAENYTEFAKSIIGINSWSEVIASR